jgi:hypothetical protein
MKADTGSDMKPTGLLEVVSKLLISALAVIWIGWQLYGGLKILNDDQWPFTGYPMYSVSHKVGDPIFQPKLIGYTLGGKQVEVTGEDLGIRYYALVWRTRERGPEGLLAKTLALYNQTRREPQERLSRLDLVHEGQVYGLSFPLQPYKKTIFTYEVPK